VAVHVHDADGGTERAVAAVLLELLAAGRPAAVAIAAVAAATASATTAAAVRAAATASAAAPVVTAIARVDDGLDVAHGGGRQAHPRGEDRIARLDALSLLGAHRRPLHRLAVVASLGLQCLADRLGAADALDRGDQACLRARGPRRRGRGRRGLLRLLRGGLG